MSPTSSLFMSANVQYVNNLSYNYMLILVNNNFTKFFLVDVWL